MKKMLKGTFLIVALVIGSLLMSALFTPARAQLSQTSCVDDGLCHTTCTESLVEGG